MSAPRHFLVVTATFRVPVESPFKDFDAATVQADELRDALYAATNSVQRMGGTIEISRIRMSSPRNAGGTADDSDDTGGDQPPGASPDSDEKEAEE